MIIKSAFKSLSSSWSVKSSNNVRSIFGWFDAAFNKYDEERVAEVGIDRATAEWVLRCGGSVTWSSGSVVSDYNKLPAGAFRQHKIMAIDGTDSCIMEHGFLHLKGLTELVKMTLVNNKYLTDDSVEMLVNTTKKKLLYLHLANNGNISDQGLAHLKRMQKLQYLKLENLQELKRPQDTLSDLISNLPNCKVEFPPYTNTD